jgi:cyclophilin family peptidyl-prolyl cis-trans isomerase
VRSILWLIAAIALHAGPRAVTFPVILSVVAIAALAMGCERPKPDSTATPPASLPATAASLSRQTLLVAEDRRRAADVPMGALASPDARLRRAAARAFARIGEDAREPLLRALADDDAEVVAWAAYGLGQGCRGHEESNVRALAARVVGLDAGAAAISAIARSVGRCGGPLAEDTLRTWLALPAFTESAAHGLGDIAQRRSRLDDASLAALLDAPSLAALSAVGRLPQLAEGWMPRVQARAERALRLEASPERIFAVRALARCGAAARGPLAAVARDPSFSVAERGEAVRALRGLGAPAIETLGALIVEWSPPSGVALDAFAPETALLELALGADGLTPETVPTLARLSGTPLPADPPAARRIAPIRCAAAAALAEGAFASAGLVACGGPAGAYARGRAELVVLGRRALTGERRKAWLALARSADPRLREAALALVETHGELADAGRLALAEALASRKAGLVSVAADAVHRHPERVLVSPETIDPAIAEAMTGALAFPWPEDRVEARLSLMDAASTVRLPGAEAAIRALCKEPSAVVRERAGQRLRALGDAGAHCPAPPEPAAAPETAHPLETDVRVEFATDAGVVAVVFEPGLAPIASTRFVELARAGFFRGIVVHRVVPSFVVQLGDPDGDGFGGSGTLLRCETSPQPFRPLDVGIATAGRDTGSSQLFVTLSRTVHLDGEYARIGRAEGDWARLHEGDVVREARVVGPDRLAP